MAIAETPEPPYYAVIFTSLRHEQPDDGYEDTADRMFELAADQPGFLGVESARHGLGITVCYWTDEASIAAWKAHAEHALAQERGRTEWYLQYALRVARVERAYTVTTGLGVAGVGEAGG
jgi:heme-degrading monooxygenase HmoA